MNYLNNFNDLKYNKIKYNTVMGAKETSPQLEISQLQWKTLPMSTHYRNDYGNY